MDKDVKEVIAGIHDGTLAEGLKKNMKYTAMGIAIGGAAGIFIATLSGKSRFMYAVVGGVLGGATGRIVAK